MYQAVVIAKISGLNPSHSPSSERPTKTLPNEHLEYLEKRNPSTADSPLQDGISKSATFIQALILPQGAETRESASPKQPPLASFPPKRSDDRATNPHRPNFRYVWNQISFLAPILLVHISRGAAWKEQMLEIGSLSDPFPHPISGCLVSRFATMTPVLPAIAYQNSSITHARSLV